MNYYAVERSSYLQHHGILGQKWGVRRYQNYDGTLKNPKTNRKKAEKRQAKINKLSAKGIRSKELRDAHTIPAGTKIYRVTASENDSSDGVKYVSYADADRVHYKGGWIRGMGDTGTSYEHEYDLTEDIHVPSRKENYEIVTNVLKDNPSLADSTIKSWIDMVYPKDSIERMEISSTGPDNGMTEKEAWDDFVNSITSNYHNSSDADKAFQSMQTLGVNKPLMNAVKNECQKRGYNGMTDEASVGGQHGWQKEGIDPLIIFNNSSLKETNKHQIAPQEEQESLRAYNGYRNAFNPFFLDKKKTQSEW